MSNVVIEADRKMRVLLAGPFDRKKTFSSVDMLNYRSSNVMAQVNSTRFIS